MKSVVSMSWTGTAALVACLALNWTARAEDTLASQAVAILKNSCGKCHGETKPKGGFQVMARDKWSEPRSDGELPFFTKDDLSKSSIWQQISDDTMPPKNPLSAEDKATIKEWLLAGAAFQTNEPADQTPIPSATDLASLAAAVKETKEELATKAFTILRTRCDECHGAVNQSFPGLEVLNPDKLLADRGKDRRGDEISRFAHPGKPDASMMIQVLKSNRMPPGPSGKKLPDGEKALLYKWILEGANFPDIDRSTRPVVAEEELLEEIANDLFNAPAAQRKFLRYFSFAHQGNNPKVTNEKMALYRAGFSKAINSLSGSSGLFLPRPVGRKDSNVRKAQVLYRIDFSEYGWDEIEHWQPILKAYPYGVDPRAIRPNPKVGQFYQQIEALYGKASFDGVVYIRADWFTATATRPPLYHILAGTPKTQKELETKLGIDIISNFKLSKARRGGVQKSGVSQQNRLIEIHRTQQGIALVSYDFFTNAGRGNLARFPLGPNFAGNEFTQHAFTHDGGEIIYTLPNKLHGYMLVKSNGERLDAGPVEIVYDQRQALGTPQIKNGVSCMLCHNKGTIPFKDTIRDAAAVLNAEARAKVEELYSEASEMDALLEDERDQYTNALKKVVEPFLLPNGPLEGRKSFEDFDEAVGVTTVDFTTDITRDQAAFELGLDPEAFKGALANSKKLNELGLRPLVSGERLKRSLWESDGATLSVFQEVASELGLGTPVRN
jgi:hypothetical protein